MAAGVLKYSRNTWRVSFGVFTAISLRRFREIFVSKRNTAIALAATAVLTASWAASVAAQGSRDYIYIVGSSTVYPFSTVVAERFGRSTRFSTPKVEPTGSGGGIKLFCEGVGVDHPDIVNASRRIKAAEVETCADNNVEDIVEVKIGYDGIVIANAIEAEPIDLTLKQLYLALARQVPDPQGGEALIDNPYMKWSEIDPSLPDKEIEVLGPPPTSGTRDAFVELAMEGGCKEYGWIKALKGSDGNRYKTVCHTLREDGAFVEAGEKDNVIILKLESNPDAFGIFGFSFLDQNFDKVQGASIDGVEPTFDAIADGSYPISRSLYFYVKKAHVDVIPGMRQFLAEFTSEKATGEEGYLAERGLIPLSPDEREEMLADVEELAVLKLAASD